MKKTLLSKNALRSLFWCFALALLLLPGKGWGQTYYNMSSGNYSETFTAWSGYPTNWNGLAILGTGSIPVATKTTTATNGTLATIAGSTAIGYDAASSTKLVFLGTGATDNSAAVACDLNLDFTGRNAGNLSFDYALILNSAAAVGRASSLIVYYSIDGTNWSSLTSYTVYNTTGASTVAVPVSLVLPAAFNNQATCKLRFYEYNGGTVVGTPSGSRPKISLDNIVVTAVSVPVVSTASPTGTVGAPFTYNIVATNSPTSYAVSSGILPAGLTLNTASGAITGTPTTAETQIVGVTATNAGGTSASANLSFTISAAGLTSQSISFGALTPVIYGDASFGLTATASSGLTVTYASSNTAVATVSGNNVTIIGAGSTNITASQSGNGSYNPAADVLQNLNINTKILAITGAAATSRAYNTLLTTDITGTLTGIINSDDVNFVGTLKGAFADATVATGKAVSSACTLAGTKSGNYSLTQPTGLTADITKAPQTITFGALANRTTLNLPFSLLLNASSGLAISYVSSNTAVATVSGNTVTIVGPGSTNITASQTGDANYFAATDVPQALTVVNNAIYLNEFTGASACPTNGNIASVSANASGSPLTRSTITCTTIANLFNSSTLNNTASINDGSYIEFSATAASGYRLNLNSLSFYRQGSGTAPNSLEVRYSTDGFVTSTSWGAAPVTPTSGTIATWDFADFSSANAGTVAFRIYPYGTQRADLTATAAAATGTFRLDDVTINGTVFSSNMTLIPDPNFEQALITLGLDSSPIDGQVLTSSISDETNLDVSGYGITNLTGIADFASLQELYCENNSLTSLDVSALTNLVNLLMLGNHLTTLSAHPNLTYLDCDDNAFTTLDVSGLTNLTDLYCSGNGLTSLNVRGLTNLQYFECKNNPSLSCILVDDVAAAYIATTTNSPGGTPFWAKDAAAIYSNCDCGNTTTWNGSTWSSGAPTTGKSAIIAGDYSVPANIIACSLTVNNNAVVTIPSGSSVTLNGALTVSSGSFTLENNANLIQSTNVANSGNITVKRNSALQVRLDHTLWSSPVTGAQTLAGFSPNTLANRFYSFDTATNKYAATVSTGTFTAGKGVAVRAPNDYTTTPTTFNGVFTGVPNNGPIPVALNITAPGNNLVGNPYPSTIDAAAFVNVANNPNIGGTLYFYAHTLSMDANGIFPTGTNYAVWTSGSGGTAATLGTSGVPANVPNGIIQAGQGFFVKATGAGNVNFTNTMRVNNTANQFFKTSSTKTEAIERHRIWLNLTNGAGTEFNQILVAYAAGATQDVDRDYDGLAFGNTGSALSSKIAGEDYTIQGRALPFTPDDVVALGFKAATDGNYSISLSNMDGLFLDTQEIFIKDNTTGKTQSLKGTPYTFTSTAGVHDTRFELLYSKTLGVSEPTFDKTGVVVYKKEGVFYVNSNGINIKEISVFDMRGRLIGKQSNINSNTSTLRGLSSTVGVLLLKIVSDKNETVTIKVIN